MPTKAAAADPERAKLARLYGEHGAGGRPRLRWLRCRRVGDLT